MRSGGTRAHARAAARIRVRVAVGAGVRQDESGSFGDTQASGECRCGESAETSSSAAAEGIGRQCRSLDAAEVGVICCRCGQVMSKRFARFTFVEGVRFVRHSPGLHQWLCPGCFRYETYRGGRWCGNGIEALPNLLEPMQPRPPRSCERHAVSGSEARRAVPSSLAGCRPRCGRSPSQSAQTH